MQKNRKSSKDLIMKGVVLCIFASIHLIFFSTGIYPGEEEPGSGNIMDKVTDLKKALTSIRELTFKKNITCLVKTREEIKALIERMVDKDYTPVKVDALKKSLVELGFLQQKVNLRQVLIDFYASEAVGFYDIDSSTLSIASDLVSESDLSENETIEDMNRVLKDNLGVDLEDFTILHELHHALIDQNYNIKNSIENAMNNFDRELAVLSAAEGDAYLTNLLFIFSPLGVKAEIMESELPATDLLNQRGRFSFSDKENDYPAYLVSISLFPYIQGLDFVREIYRNYGWKGVNSIYASLPLSTEQILHPKKYLNEKDNPKEAKIIDLRSVIGKNWKEIAKDTLGEFRIYLLINLMLGKEDTALLASEGWGGDTYLLFENEKGERILYISTIWDTEKDAREFWDAYRRSLLAGSFKSNSQTDKDISNTQSLTSGNTEIFLKIEGNSVEVIKASPEYIRKIFSEKRALAK